MFNNLTGVYLDADGRPLTGAGRVPLGGERKPTGDEIMAAARGAASEAFPDAAPTASDHANQVGERICDLLGGHRGG